MNDKPIPFFKRFVIQNFPFIEEDFDALTNYQLFCKVVEYLNKVIGSQNEVTQQMEYVLNYFNTLDVQDEVDHKLDEMAASGELAAIIAEYLNAQAIQSFDTIADMQASTILVDGAYAQTFGFHTINDGGAGKYKIRTITNSDTIDNMTLFAVGTDNLVAELVVSEILPETLGAYGDGTHDDYQPINKLIELNNSGRKVSFSPKVYGVGSPIIITLTSECRLDFNNCTLKGLNSTMECVVRVDAHELMNVNQNGKFINLTIDQDYKTPVGLDLYSSNRIIYDNIALKNIPVGGGIGLWVSGRYSGENNSAGNLFTNIRGSGDWNNSYQTIYDYCTFIKIDAGDNTFSNLDYQNVKRGFEINGFSVFNNVHGFVALDNRYIDSYFMKFNAGALVSNAYPDTQQFAFINNTNHSISISNAILIFNNSAVTDETLAAHPSYSFISPVANRANLTVNGLQISNNKQTLYLRDAATINETAYAKTTPIISQATSDHASITYSTTPFIMSTMTDGSTYFTGALNYAGDMQNMRIQATCKTAFTNKTVRICKWNTGVYRNYALIEGWHPAVIKHGDTYTPSAIIVNSSQEVVFVGSMSLNDIIVTVLPMVQKQVGQE